MTGTTSAPAEQPVTFQLWGAVEARKNGQRIAMGSPRELCMLTGLIAANGREIQRAALTKWIWDDEPASASDELNAFMTRLRRRLEELGFDRALINANGLCRLAIPPAAIDVHRVGALMVAPKRDDHHAAELLGEAVRLSDGEPLAGLNGLRIDSYRTKLHQERQALRIAYYQVEARLGRYREHVGELNRLFDEHPGDDSVTALTMYAMYFAGARPEALEVYRKHAQYLATEVGIDPSAEIGNLHRRVLDDVLAKDSYAVGKPYQTKGGRPMDPAKALVLAIRPDTGDLEELRQTVAESFDEGELRTRLADDCLIGVVSPTVAPVQVVQAWMDKLVGTVRQRALVGIAIGDEDRVRELARSEYAKRVLNGAPRGSNLVITVSDDLYELVTGFPGGQLDATGYRRAENDVGGWVRVPGLSVPPHVRDDDSDREVSSGQPPLAGPKVEFRGKTRIRNQTIASVINKGRR